MSVDGRDVTDSGFSVGPGTFLDVVVSANGATIEGAVVDDKGKPVAYATVVDIPTVERRTRWDLYQSDDYRPTRPLQLARPESRQVHGAGAR